MPLSASAASAVLALSTLTFGCGGVAVLEPGDDGAGGSGSQSEPRCPTGCLELGASLSVGYGAHDVITTDCNGDGHRDLVVASDDTNLVHVFRGHGDGTFEPGTTIDGGPSPWVPAAADFDEDWRVDLAIANFIEGVHVVLGDGECGFSALQEIVPGDPLGQWSTAGLTVTAGDLDGDGHVDLASESEGPDSEQGYVTLSWGRGDGSFEPPSFVPVVRDLGTIAIADLDGDGHADLIGSTSWLALSSEGGLVSVLRGLGDRTFAPVKSDVLGGDLEGLVIADFDVDDRLDAATVGTNWVGDLSVLRGDGLGGFSPVETYAGMAHSAGDLETADFDGDGRLDLVLTAGNESAVMLVLGDATSGFAQPVLIAVDPIEDPNSDWNPFKLTIDDLNEDGHPDVAATHHVGVVSLLLSRP